MSEHRFVMAARTFTDVELERRHLAGEPVALAVAPLETPSQIAEATTDADGIIVTVDPLDAERIDALGPGVRVIGRVGIGLDAIDLDAARARGIGVVHTPDYATEEVATHALALILASSRRILPGDGVARSDFGAWRSLAPVRPLSEQTALVIGLGRIGAAVAQLLLPLFGRVVGHDPFATALPVGVVGAASLDEALAEADVVTLHLPLSAESAGLIGVAELERMKRSAVLVNVARGGLVDQAALAAALRDGVIGGAGLDVLVQEPPVADDPILAAPNVVLSPHFAWYSDSAERRARTQAADAMLDYLEDRPLRAGRVACDPRDAAGTGRPAGTRS